MPPPASHRLSLLLAPRGGADVTGETGASWRAPGWTDPTWAGAALAWFEQQQFVINDAPGPRPLVEGGFLRATAVRHDRVRFVPNRQGGFRVRCPRDGRNLVPAFQPAVTAWRDGTGERQLACPCGEVHDLIDLEYQPPAVYAASLILLEEPATAELTADASSALEARFGRMQVGLRRG